MTLNEDYMRLIKGELTNVSYKMSRDTGHLVLEFNSSKESQYYLSLNPYLLVNGSNLLKVTYSHPTTPRLAPASRDLSYIIQRDSVIIKASAINDPSPLTYILLVSNNQSTLKAAAQCSSQTLFNLTRKVVSSADK